jgi:hypothetical protein
MTVSPEEIARQKAAERQRRYSARKRASGYTRHSIWLPKSPELVKRVKTYIASAIKKHEKE